MSDADLPTHTTDTELEAAPADVWEALTSPEGVEAWLGEGSSLSPVEGSDLDVADVETGVRKFGRVDTVVPGRRLGFVWWPAGPGGDDTRGQDAARVAIELVPAGDGTLLTITETPVEISASVAGDAWAWRSAAVEVRLFSPHRVLVRPSC